MGRQAEFQHNCERKNKDLVHLKNICYFFSTHKEITAVWSDRIHITKRNFIHIHEMQYPQRCS